MTFVFAQYKNKQKDTKIWHIKVNKKEFHKSKPPIDLGLVKVDQIVVSDKCKQSYDDFKYFIGYKKVKLLTVKYCFTSNKCKHKILWKWWQKHVFCNQKWYVSG